jgi:hypothetical protein
MNVTPANLCSDHSVLQIEPAYGLIDASEALASK